MLFHGLKELIDLDINLSIQFQILRHKFVFWLYRLKLWRFILEEYRHNLNTCFVSLEGRLDSLFHRYFKILVVY